MRKLRLTFALLSWSLAGCASQRLPAVVQAAAPNYPKVAQIAHVEGDMVVTVEIRRDGKVSNAAIVSGPALVVLRQECLVAAKEWIFASGSAANRRQTLTFEFKIAGESGSEQKVKFLPPYRVMTTAPPIELESKQPGASSKPSKQ